MLRLRACAPLLLLPLCLPACAMFGGAEDGVWVERELPDVPRRELLGYCARGMSQAGYPAPEILEAADEVRSAWRTELQPFGGNGLRRRAHLRLAAAADGGVLLQARVEMQRNEELARPLDLAEADWSDAPDDETGARILMQHVVALLASSGVGGGQAESAGGRP